MIRPRSSALALEPLEPREVPAVVLDGTFTGSTANGTFKVTGNSGNVTITKIGGDAPFVAFGPNGLNGVATTKPATNADTLTLDTTGSTLALTNSDGIFVKLQNGNFVNMGNSFSIDNVTGLTVNLQLGGNDTVTDNTSFASTINGGPGSDTLTATVGALNPALIPFLFGPTGLNAGLVSLLIAPKTLDGGTGDDTLTGPIIGFLNTLRGGDGNDTVIGGLGLDIIDGGAGFDILFGQSGGDIYLALDGGPDFILNVKGDVVVADPLDLRNP